MVLHARHGQEYFASILGDKRRAVVGRDSADDRPVLAPYVSLIRRNRLRAQYKGKYVRAGVRSDGSITVRGPGGRNFNSPSLAARHVLGRNATEYAEVTPSAPAGRLILSEFLPRSTARLAAYTLHKERTGNVHFGSGNGA